MRSSKDFGNPDGKTYALAVADMDNDGQLDIVVGNSAQSNVVYFNQGRAQDFREVRFGDPAHLTYNLAVGDLNRDGFADIAVANSDAQNRVFLNLPPRR